MAVDRSDPLVQRAEVEPFNERPHEARPVIGRQEALEVGRVKRDLITLRSLESWSCPSLGLSWAGFRGREVEQLIHAGNRSCERPSWESLTGKIHSLLAGTSAEACLSAPDVASSGTRTTRAPRALAILSMVLVVGAARPFSKRDMSDFATPVNRDRSAWVNWRCRRKSRACLAMSLCCGGFVIAWHPPEGA